MIRHTRVVMADGTDPVRNLALEAYLLETVPADTCVLYLWQNAHTVVIGRNQNAWRECHVTRLQEDGGTLVRRLSGGGAVYHDMGNLNFTFLLPVADYDVERQQQVILRAVQDYGIPAERTGRNDLTVSGRKFSGNAFYKQAGRAYHHGTLLLNTDMEKMSRYLSVDPQKLSGKGVASVRARVVNLSAINPAITVEGMCEKLTGALGEVYGNAPQHFCPGTEAQTRLHALQTQFASWDWIYGRPIPFSWRVQKRFAWGNMEICLEVNAGRIERCVCYSDALDEGLAPRLASLLTGCVFDARAMAQALGAVGESQAVSDVQAFLLEQENESGGE